MSRRKVNIGSSESLFSYVCSVVLTGGLEKAVYRALRKIQDAPEGAM